METGLETRVLPFADNPGQLKGIVSFDSSFAELGAGWSYVLLFASKEFVALHSGPRLGRSERARWRTDQCRLLGSVGLHSFSCSPS